MTNRKNWRVSALIALLVFVLLVSGLFAGATFRNRFSGKTVVGHWRGYALQPTDANGSVVKVPCDFTFRPDGIVIRGERTDANYMVCRNVLIFYRIRSKNAPSQPVPWEAEIVGDTLTLSGDGKPVAVLRRC